LRCIASASPLRPSQNAPGPLRALTAPSPTGGSTIAAKTVAAFATGTWHVTFPLDKDRDPLTLTVTDGQWSTDDKGGTKDTWQYAGDSLHVRDWRKSGATGTATGLSAEVEPSALTGS